jgi:hypothetical protein
MPIVTLHHRTGEDVAKRVVANGFNDDDGYYLTNNHHSGVWFSDQVLDANEGAFGDTIIRIRLDELEIAPFEWIEEGRAYREWLIPAQVVNESGSVEIVGARIDRQQLRRPDGDDFSA